MVSVEQNKEDCKMKSVRGYCPKPLEEVADYLSKKWMISIVITLSNFKMLRFNNLLGRINGMTAKVLSGRLKELEKERIIGRKISGRVPLSVEYRLTKKGIDLMKVLKPLIIWSKKK